MSDAGQVEHVREWATISETREIPVVIVDLLKIGIEPSSSHTGEAVGVAIEMGSGPAIVYGATALAAFDELGITPQ